MTRDTYIIVLVDRTLVPSSVAYVGHGDTPYDLNLRLSHFRTSATQYSAKRDAIREAKRLAGTYVHRLIKVVGYAGRQCAWQNKEN